MTKIAALAFEEIEPVDAPMSAEEWLFNIATFGFAAALLMT